MNRGIIAMWAGRPDDIPDGWVLCDGTNRTPDLRDKFVLGSVDDVGTLGGAAENTLTMGNIPEHKHSINHTHGSDFDVSPKKHSHTFTRTRTDIVGANYERNTLEQGGDRGLYTGDSVETDEESLSVSGGVKEHEGKSGSAGQAKPLPIPNLPPFYKIAFIMKT